MQIYNNWTRGGMKSEKVHFSRFFFEIFNLKLTQFNMISPRASGAKKVAMQGTDGNNVRFG